MVWSLNLDHQLEKLGASIPERKQHMASLVLKMSVSLDGYVASADGSNDWVAAGRSDDSTGWVLETVTRSAWSMLPACTS